MPILQSSKLRLRRSRTENQLKVKYDCKKEIDMVLPVAIESSAKRLFPNLNPEQAIVELLLERAQRNLVKYESAAREFASKYGQDFETFRKKILSSKPDSAAEQDYFDWELAVTGAADMRDEIERLEEIDSDLWDEQIERDAKSGRLDDLLAEVDKEYDA